MEKKNKVKFNLKNVHFATYTLDEDGQPQFKTPIPIPGAVSMSMERKGEIATFFADGYEYYVSEDNNGYEGDIELAMVPDSFRQEVLCEELDQNGVLIERSNVETKPFAMLWQFDGDVNEILHVLYNCHASRPNMESKTNEGKKEPQTEKLAIKAPPLNGLVKARSSGTTTDETRAAWFSKVYIPQPKTAEEAA